jgi:protoporphyrinogen oxidase
MKTTGIIGGGPAGLTAALEILRRDAQHLVVVFEADKQVGGLSKTIDFKGYKIDIGGHRFFSKSPVVMRWWNEIMPFTRDHNILFTDPAFQYHGNGHASANGKKATENDDNMMLVKKRLSRIYYKKKFYDYPLTLNLKLLQTIGFMRSFKILASYLRSRLGPARRVETLEDFFIHRFGKELYTTFFKDYTEKVWGKPCVEISPEWGAQRIKGVSFGRIFRDMFARRFSAQKEEIAQQQTDTSLINYFLYPKYGPGQLWEAVEKKVIAAGGLVKKEHPVVKIKHREGRVYELQALDSATGITEKLAVDHVISSMPICDLITCLDPQPPEDICHIARNLEYRDFMIVGVLTSRFAPEDKDNGVRDNWIYINDPDTSVGRIQIFNNWSDYMIADPSHYWIGMEYFVSHTEALWNMPDEAVKDFAYNELVEIGFCDRQDILDGVVIRVPKAYPGYYGVYNDFDKLRRYLDGFPNLFVVGRNGMHKYNNQDHSMITAMEAVKNIFDHVTCKDNIWAVNTDQGYLEAKNKPAVAKKPV